MEQTNYRVLLPKRQFLKLLLADLVRRFGDSLDVIAYTWIMYEVTGSESLALQMRRSIRLQKLHSISG